MATTSANQQPTYAARAGLPTFGNFGNALLERGNPGIRKSTPDSEALASSDEEVEQSRLRSAAQRKVLQNRRPSLLAEQNADPPRRLSLAGNSYSPLTGSQPNTPGVQHDSWPSISPSIGAWNSGSAYPFGTSIWGANSRDPPARLQEVRQDNSEGRIPFTIPSQPNLSVQRSMSFSVGQSEYENTSNMDAARTAQGLTRRTSRPGTLGHEYSSGLSRVNENEDGDQDFVSAAQVAPASRGQNRTMSSASMLPTGTGFRSTRLRTSAMDSEVAIDDVDDSAAQLRYPVRSQPPRRMSDFQSTTPVRQPIGPPYSSASFGVAKNMPHWSSNLDFGQLDTIPQSRRHSFADVPTRRGSLGSNEDDEQSVSYDTGSQGLSQEHEASYFSHNVNIRRDTERDVHQQLQQEHHQAIYGPASPYGIPSSASSIGAFHGPNPAPLYVVNFKCCRSDIFYIQEGTGLSVKDGDLVIVEADRGTDLGCVQHSHVTWEAARKFKNTYAEQHFAWLMMFSSQARSGAANLYNPNAVVPGRNGANPQGGGAIRDGDLKPKMVKRLAQTHEIQALQEKEGNEAKAKRVCQQKVAEHGLNMEILDAEFQMDGKKLTFYFFSNEYINFNALVTDLFKMYKTRIWMSAINPASFQSPVSSLGLTPIYPNAGLGVTNTATSVNTYDDNRPEPSYMTGGQPLPASRAMPALYYGGYGQAPQLGEYGGFGGSYAQASSDPFSSYTIPPGYGMPGARPQNMPVNRQDGGSRGYPMTSNANTLANQFGSLSLAR